MKIFLIILFIVGVSLRGEIMNAQYLPLVEESKYWIYYDFQARPRPTSGFLITIQGDSTLQNKLYKKVFKYELYGEIKNLAINEPPQFVADFPYKIKDKKLISLIREDIREKRVYNLPINQDSCNAPISGVMNPCNDIIFCDTNEHILFDFSLKTGDTLNYCSFAPLHYDWEIHPEKVDSIKMEIHFGRLRKTFYTIGVPNYLPNLIVSGQNPIAQVRIIEGIGFQYQGIFNYRFGNLVDYCEGDFNICDIVSSTNELRLTESLVNIYPNPTSDYLRFEATSRITKISLINLNFVELVSVENENLLDINAIPAGIYICRIKFDNGSIVSKKIIKLNQ